MEEDEYQEIDGQPVRQSNPRFIGRWFPRDDAPKDRDIYCASMLVLLQPWKELQDIRHEGESFETRFQQMMESATPRIANFVQNVQYYHQCIDAVNAPGEEDGLIGLANVQPFSTEERPITEMDIEVARAGRRDERELANAEAAIDNAYTAGFFKDFEEDDDVPKGQAESCATSEEMDQITKWEKLLKTITRNMANENGMLDLSHLDTTEPETRERKETNNQSEPLTTIIKEKTIAKNRPKLLMLNKEQRRAHDIVEEKLQQEHN